jgi:D-alanine-D-alanine ligase
VLPPMEIKFKKNTKRPVYDYAVKQEWEEHVYYECPAKLTESEQRAMEKIARATFWALDCRDVARVDMRMDEEGRIYVLEVNPLPGLTPNYSDLVLISQAAGMEYDALIAEIMVGGLRRMREKRREERELEREREAKENKPAASAPEKKRKPETAAAAAAAAAATANSSGNGGGTGNGNGNGNGGSNSGGSSNVGSNGGASSGGGNGNGGKSEAASAKAEAGASVRGVRRERSEPVVAAAATAAGSAPAGRRTDESITNDN